MTLRRLILPVASVLALSMVAIVTLALFAASEQDRIHVRSERASLSFALKGIRSSLVSFAQSNALWDDAVENIMIDEDLGWIRENMAVPESLAVHFDWSVVFNADGRVIFSNRPIEDVFLGDLKRTGLETFRQFVMAGDKGAPVQGSAAFLSERQLVLAGAAAVDTNHPEGPYGRFPPGPRPVIMFFKIVRPQDLREVQKDIGLTELAFEAGDTPPSPQADTDAFLPIAGQSEVIGHLVWSTYAPGSKLLEQVWIPTLLVFAAFAVALAYFLGEANRLMRALDAASESKSRFLATMSHEVRTPLNAIIGFSEVLKGEFFGPLGSDKNREYVDNIIKSGGHLLAILNDILDFSKVEADRYVPRMQPVNITEAVEDCIIQIEDKAREKGITLSHRVEPSSFHSDPRLLRQIILNLLSNATKFTDSGGRITVTGAPAADGATYSLVVEDTGLGMTPEELRTALEPFGQINNHYDRNQDGTGLGLPLVVRFAKLLGGHIDIKSAPGQGTRITLRLCRRQQGTGQDMI